MSIVVLKLPAVKQKSEERPGKCPYCEGETFQRWGQVNKPVRDVHVRKVKVYRYRCCRCKRTFRHYPEGNTRADQTERLKLFAVLLWKLGLGHRASSLILSGLRVWVSHMTIWRNVQAEAQMIMKRNQWKPARMVGLDGGYVLGWGGKQPVLVAVDLGSGEPLAVGYVNEHDPQALQGGEREAPTGTPDLPVPYPALGGQSLAGVTGDRSQRLALGSGRNSFPHRSPAPDGSKSLHALWKQLPGHRFKPDQARAPMEQLRDLLLRLSQDWHKYCTFQSEPLVPWTNNATEHSIGRMKPVLSFSKG